MLVKPQIESLLPHVENRYSLAILVAKRARQLVDGGQPLCDSDSPNNVSIACQELYEDRIVCVQGVNDFFIPIRPEIEAARLERQRAIENAAAVENIKEMFSRLDEVEAERDDAAAILRQIEAIGEEAADEAPASDEQSEMEEITIIAEDVEETED